MEISDILYADSFGEVRKCVKEGVPYLIKIIRKKDLKYKNQSETLNEMCNLLAIRNKNLSEYKDFYFNDNGDLVILMEYEEDSEFNSKINYNIENHVTFEEDYIWTLTLQLLKLVKFIKDNKNIKFDLNLSKILLMDNDLLKLCDYGLDSVANSFSPSTLTPIENYTIPPEYIDDENIKNEDAGYIWSAGCIIYELIFLQHIFDAKSMLELGMKLSKFRGVYEINMDCKYSTEFKDLLNKMLIAETEKRATIEELLNFDIIKKRNNEIEQEKNLIRASIYTFKQSLLKSSLKESIRQFKNQNEMMSNDNYEILKLSKNAELNKNDFFDLDKNFLKQTGHFGSFEEKEINNNNNNNDDFKERLIAEKLKKENINQGIIQKNNYNYNNPYRDNNNNIFNINNNNNLVDKHNEQAQINIYETDKNKKKQNNLILKGRKKSPLLGNNKQQKMFLNVDKIKKNNINNIIIKNKNENNNKRNDIYPLLNNQHIKQNNMIISKDGIKNKNKNNLIKKTENVLNMIGDKKKNNYKVNNFLKNNKQINNRNISSMTNDQIDSFLHNILKKQNIRITNNTQKNQNFINNKGDKNKIKPENQIHNKIVLKKSPIEKQNNILPNITYKTNKNINIIYGKIDYKSTKGKKKKYILKKNP